MANIWSYLLCFQVLVCIVNGGIVRVAGPDEEAYALRMWRDMCQNGRRDFAMDGNNNAVFCAQDENSAAGVKTTVEVVHPTIKLPSQATPANQVIVIEPPSQHFSHKINIEGDSAPAPKTTIYVKPREDKHQLEIIQQQDRNSNSPPPKPTILFLGQNGNVDSEARVFGSAGSTTGEVARIQSSSNKAYQLQGQGSEIVEQRRRLQKEEGERENQVGQGFLRSENSKTETGSDADISASVERLSSTKDQDQSTSSSIATQVQIPAGEVNTETGSGGAFASSATELSLPINQAPAADSSSTTTVTSTPPITATVNQGQVPRNSENARNQAEILSSAQIKSYTVQGEEEGEKSVQVEEFPVGGISSRLVGGSSSIVGIGGVRASSVDGETPSQSNSGFGNAAFQSGIGNGESTRRIENQGFVGEQGSEIYALNQGQIGANGATIVSLSQSNSAGTENERLVGEPGSVQYSSNQGQLGSKGAAGSDLYFSLRAAEISPETGDSTTGTKNGDGSNSEASYAVRYGNDRSSGESSYQIGAGVPSTFAQIDGTETIPGQSLSQSSGSQGLRTFQVGTPFSETGSIDTTSVLSNIGGVEGTVTQQDPTTQAAIDTAARYAPGAFDFSDGLEPFNAVTTQNRAPSFSIQQETRTSSSSSSTSSRNPNLNNNENRSSVTYSVNDPSQNSGGVPVLELNASSKSLTVNTNLEGQRGQTENGQSRRQRRKKQRGQGRQRQGQQNVDPNGDATSSVFFEMDHSEMMHYSVRHPY